jgi:hypothetical protein
MIVSANFPVTPWDGLSLSQLRANRTEDMQPDYSDWNSIVAELIAVQAKFIYNPKYRGCVEYVADLENYESPMTGDFAVCIATQSFWYYDSLISLWVEIGGSGTVIARRELLYTSDDEVTLFEKQGIANLTVKVTEVFDGTTEFSIKNTTDDETILASTEIDLSVLGEYICPTVKSYTVTKLFKAIFTNNTSTQGKLEVYYVI